MNSLQGCLPSSKPTNVLTEQHYTTEFPTVSASVICCFLAPMCLSLWSRRPSFLWSSHSTRSGFDVNGSGASPAIGTRESYTLLELITGPDTSSWSQVRRQGVAARNLQQHQAASVHSQSEVAVSHLNHERAAGHLRAPAPAATANADTALHFSQFTAVCKSF